MNAPRQRSSLPKLPRALLRAGVTLIVFVAIVAAFLLGLQFGGDPAGSGAPLTTDAAAAPAIDYTCSMHPQVRAPAPGRCPICAMDLIPASSAPAGTDPAAPLPLTEAAVGLADIRTAKVVRQFPTKSVRLVGQVELDETRLAKIAAYFPGRIERLYVDYTGVPVRQGDHLAELYSPDLLVAQEELIQARRALESQVDTQGTMRVLTEATLEAAREKLRLWGLTEEQIARVAEAEAPAERITVYSPDAGVVIERHATQGQYVKAGEDIYTLADLSHLWVILEVYESQLPWLHYGQLVRFTTDARPGETFEGRISFIEPMVSSDTRTVQVRVNVDNAEGRLKPGMFVRSAVDVRIGADGAVFDDELTGKWISPMHPEIVKEGPGACDVCGMALVRAEEIGFARPRAGQTAPLVVPASAPLITGTRALVYVRDPDADEPRFSGREVVLGARAGDVYVVRSGLTEGEEVVVKGAFKIDSAMQIEARGGMMSAPPARAAAPAATTHGHDHSTSAAPEAAASLEDWKRALDASLTDYLTAQRALADDDLSGFVSAASSGLPPLAPLAVTSTPIPGIERLRSAIPPSPDLSIDEAREVFLAWSQLLLAASQRDGLSPTDADVVVAYCPMAFDDTGAEWIQRGNAIENPYFGHMMRACGEVRRPLMEAGR